MTRHILADDSLTVAEQAEAALSLPLQLVGTCEDACTEGGEGERFLFITERGGIGACFGKMAEQMLKAVKSHGAPPLNLLR